jgi:alpha-1,6-mannosyltransferase
MIAPVATDAPARPPTGISWPVVAIGVASAGIYLMAFTLTWPLWKHVAQPQADYAWFGRYTAASQVTYLGAFAALFVLHYVAYRLVRARPDAMPLDLIVAGQVVFGLLNAWIYPVAALDLYDYLMYGRIVLAYGGNPFLQPPSAFPDPLVGYSPWPNERSVYGPVWQFISLVPTWFAGQDLMRGILSFKLLGLVAFVACTLVIWRLLRRLSPRFAVAGTLLFAWNPLLQFELVGNGHNDTVMVLFVLLAVWALVSERRLLVLPLFALAVLTKLLAIALAPIFLYGLLRGSRPLGEKLTAILGGGLIGLVLAVVAYAPFWAGLDTFYFLSRGNWFTASIPTMLRELLRQRYPFEQAGQLSAMLVGAGFAAFVVFRLALLWRDDRADEQTRTSWQPWIQAAVDVTFVYLAFATLWWQPWYLVWLAALASLLPSRVLHERTLLFCYGGVLNYLVFKYIWPTFQPMTYTTIMGISVILIFGMPLIQLACTVKLPRFGAKRGQTPAAVAVGSGESG